MTAIDYRKTRRSILTGAAASLICAPGQAGLEETHGTGRREPRRGIQMIEDDDEDDKVIGRIYLLRRRDGFCEAATGRTSGPYVLRRAKL